MGFQRKRLSPIYDTTGLVRRDAARVCTPEEVAETERYLADTIATERAKREADGAAR